MDDNIAENFEQPIMPSHSGQPTLGPSQCPPGMEFLRPTNMVFVKQMVEVLEAFSGIETANRYQILDASGRRIYLAYEITGCCTRVCLGTKRPFTIMVMDNFGQVVLKIKRPCTCCCCFWQGACCNEILVTTATDLYLGKISQNFSCAALCCPCYTVFDAGNTKLLKIKGPCFLCMCCNVRFKVSDLNGEVIGEIQKKWGGILKEVFTDADTFGVSFPVAMDPLQKTLLVAAVLLIDFMHFEDKGSSSSSS